MNKCDLNGSRRPAERLQIRGNHRVHYPLRTLPETTSFNGMVITWKPIDELRKRYNELAKLAGSLAHEIKNPLSIIVMNMELLHEDLEAMTHPESQRAVKRTETVIQQCHRLETLLNDFLRFTKLSSLELKPGSLNNQMDQVLDFFETQAAKQGVEIIRYLDAELSKHQPRPSNTSGGAG